MILFRRLLGDVLRRHRQAQGRTLRDVASAARISLGYLSEVERGRKEASSELLASLCAALDISLADVLREVGDEISRAERAVSASTFGFTGKVAVRTAPTVVVAPLAPPTTTRAGVGVSQAAPVAMLTTSRSRVLDVPVVAA